MVTKFMKAIINNIQHQAKESQSHNEMSSQPTWDVYDRNNHWQEHVGKTQTLLIVI